MQDRLPTILILLLLIAFSAYFSATETAFSSLNSIRLKNLASKGNKRARLALRLSERYDQLLSTILIGNNIVNIAAASLATTLFVSLMGPSGVSVSTVVMTVMVLIFGEISPKSLAKDMPERFAMWSSPVLNVLCLILKPVNFLFTQWKKLLSKLFHSHSKQGVTEEELLTLVNEAQTEGGIGQQAGELIRSAIEFDDLDVIDICVPRTDMVSIRLTDPTDKIQNTFFEEGFSRLPVCRDSIDNVVGIINQKDFFKKVVAGGYGLESILSPIFSVPPTMKISDLMKRLQQNRSHMALIVDEYGGTQGIVTLEDIIEELVGEIWDEHDEVVEEIEMLAPGKYRVLGTANLDDLFEFIGIEEELPFTSVNGWVSGMLDRIPKAGDQFQFRRLTVTVVSATERRAEELLIHVAPVEEEA